MTDSEVSQSVTFTKTFEDYADAQRLHAKWDAKKWFVVGGATLIMLIAGAVASFGHLPQSLDAIVSISTWFFFGGWIGGLAARFIFAPNSWKRTFATSKLLQTLSTYTWDSKEFRTSNQFGNSTIPWSSFFKVKRNGQMILLYVARNQFLPVPRRAFVDEARFTELGNLAARSIAMKAG